MKKEEVPQDDANLFEGKFRVVKYAVGEDGKFDKVPSVGWEPETAVLEQAWDEVNHRVEQARQRVLEGERSPLLFHMEKHLMEPAMLADYMGCSRLRIYWHFRPSAFNKLSIRTLERYAEVFEISVDELKTVPQQP